MYNSLTNGEENQMNCAMDTMAMAHVRYNSLTYIRALTQYKCVPYQMYSADDTSYNGSHTGPAGVNQ